MERLLAIARALGDETRLKALLALDQGELCLCELIEILELAPSTVSRHMSLLEGAGLVTRRKQGRWQYFRLTRAPGPAARALRWALEWLRQAPGAPLLAARVEKARKAGKEELCRRYREGARPTRRAVRRPKEAAHGK